MKGVVGAFANDPRILAWDVWNEPDNGNADSYAHGDPKNKNEIIIVLLPQGFRVVARGWREATADQRAVAWGLELAGSDASAGANSD